MTNPIPEERYILKQELWKRIDDSVGLINGSAVETSRRMDNLKNELTLYYDKLITLNREGKIELSNLFDKVLNEYRKILEERYSQKVNEIIKKQDDLFEFIDKKINSAIKDIDTRTLATLNRQIEDVVRRIDVVDKIAAVIEKNVNISISKNNTDIMGKFNELAKKFNLVIDKFKEISKLLG